MPFTGRIRTGDAGDQYVGLDRFGRVVDQNWYNPTTSTSAAEQQYGYDADGNVVWRHDTVNSSFSELYSYDGLNQLSTFAGGTLNSGHTAISGTASRTLSWGYDALGNWTSLTTNGTAQTRTANDQNQYNSVGGSTTPTYDANGNMTGDETGKQFVYDAWNRLVTVKSSGGSSTLETFTYDGMTRRITNTVGSTTSNRYYSSGWQVLEEQIGTQYTTRYVWSPIYVDAMLLRDTDTSGTGLTATGTGYTRLWPVHDANWNVMALVNGSGTVVERYAYDAFGSVTVLTPSFGSRIASSYGWTQGFQGMFFDSVSSLNVSRGRNGFSPTLGRWGQNDIGGYAMGDVNLNRFVANGPVSALDPTGLGEYREGEAQRPDIKWDNAYAYDPNARSTWGDSRAWVRYGILLTGAETLGHLPDGTRAYAHYRSASGTDLMVDYEKAYNEERVFALLQRQFSEQRLCNGRIQSWRRYASNYDHAMGQTGHRGYENFNF